MQPRTSRGFWKPVSAGALALMLGILTAAPASAQDPLDERLEELAGRVERLEAENRRLSAQQAAGIGALPVPPEAVMASADGFATIDEPERYGAGAPNLATNDAGDSAATAARLNAQGEQLTSVQKALKSLQDKVNEKKYPNVTINGVFQADGVWVHQDAGSLDEFGRIEDGAGFRRVRLSAKGSVTPHTNYFFQTDVGTAGIGRPTITDMWVEETNVPYLGNVRVGQWKQPFSLEVVSSFRYMTFMERSVLFTAFTPFRRLGVGFYDHSEDLSMTWAVSGFRTGQDQFGDTYSNDGGYGTSERVTFLPYWQDEGVNYLHLGLGHYFNAPPDDRIAFRTIPEMFTGAHQNGSTGSSGVPIHGALAGIPPFVSTGVLNVDWFNVVGTELLFVEGPFSLQSEAMVNFVNQGGGNPNAVLAGAYAQVGYFLTGEHRPYDRKAGAIDRVIPKRNLKFASGSDCETGWGPGKLRPACPTST